MRVFKTKWFARFARKTRIDDNTLTAAVKEIETGLNDGNLGAGLIKKRLARTGEGKRGGYRTIIVYHSGTRAIFVYGFPKNAKANLSALELEAYQRLAALFLKFNNADMEKALRAGELEEVQYNA